MYVEIRIKGHLAHDWADWFGDLDIINGANGETVLSGQLPDQAALLGLLNRTQALNLNLLSFTQSGYEKRKTPGSEIASAMLSGDGYEQG